MVRESLKISTKPQICGNLVLYLREDLILFVVIRYHHVISLPLLLLTGTLPY